jgi:hypothetical protein
MHRITTLVLSCFLLAIFTQNASAQEEPSFEERIAGLEHLEGFFDLYWDEDAGALLLRIDRFGEPFIYQSSMPRGVGSNDLGLDRGQLGTTRLVEFFRSGPKVLLIENNLDYRASTDNAAELAAVQSSFARSVTWGFEVLGEDGNTVLVDATEFFLRDAHGITRSLRGAQQGEYSADPSRSAIFLPNTRAFPDNTEIEAVMTFTGNPKTDEQGRPVSNLLSTVVPDPTALTVHLRHSLIRLPDGNYTPLPYDPRAGLIGTGWGEGFFDYSSPIGAPLRTIHARRHRLEKKTPEAEFSEAVEPIVYYVDPGAPEPIRSALVEGASWWNQAFEAAGYRDAFQVRLLPDGADPMDVRYNVIQWVHRSTRGWSYGSSVVDPRTGEIIKGHVTLGSLRVRQDYLIAEGLLAPYRNQPSGQNGDTDPMLEMSLARIRQLSAHEVGHTIGMEHNFAASVNDRASVMDYPFPLIRFDDKGGLDLSDAYSVGIGEWDKRTVLYAYQDFPDSIDDSEGRRQVMRETLDSGLLYIADQDARDTGTAHPLANLWDNGPDPLVELEHLLKVRAHALQRFSAANIRPGRPLASIEEVLVPVYLLHRYQLRAAGKLIGGQTFNYTMRGDGQSLPITVDATTQRSAIDTLISAMDPSTLVLPDALLESITARPPGHRLTRESFTRSTGVLFDPMAPAASAVSLVLDVLLNHERAARMNAFHASDGAMPGFRELLASLLDSTWKARRLEGNTGAIQRASAYQVLQRILTLSSDTSVTPEIRAQSLATVRELDRWLEKASGSRLNPAWSDHYELARHEIAMRLTGTPGQVPAGKRPSPPGSPIGND